MAQHKHKKLVVFGTGEIGSLARYYFDNDSPYQVVAFTADDEFVQADTFEGIPLVKYSDVSKRFPPVKYEMHVALSYKKLNQTRAQKYKEVLGLGYTLASYVCSKSVYWPDLSIGQNCFILENQTVQPAVKIGHNVMIWSGNHIGHGAVIGDHTYISSHVCISGHTQIGQYCFLGVNCTTKDFVKVGNRVFVAMGALVTKDIADGSVVVGAQGEVFAHDSKMARQLKKKYFNLCEED